MRTLLVMLQTPNDLTSRRRNYSPDEWDREKDGIRVIYIERKQTLDTLRRELDGKGFRPSKNKLLEKLSEWGFKKYSNAQQWRNLHATVKRNNLDLTNGDVIEVDNRSIPIKKLKKEFARYSAQSRADVRFDGYSNLDNVKPPIVRCESSVSVDSTRTALFTSHQPIGTQKMLRLPFLQLLRLLLRPMLESLETSESDDHEANAALLIHFYKRIRTALLDNAAAKRPSLDGPSASNIFEVADVVLLPRTPVKASYVHKERRWLFLMFDSVLPDFGMSGKASSLDPDLRVPFIDHDDLMTAARMFIACHLRLNGIGLDFFDGFIKWVSGNSNCRQVINRVITDGSAVGSGLRTFVLQSAVKHGYLKWTKCLLDPLVGRSTCARSGTFSEVDVPDMERLVQTALTSGNITMLRTLIDFGVDIDLVQLFSGNLRTKLSLSDLSVTIQVENEATQSLILSLIERDGTALDIDVVSCAIHSGAGTNFVDDIFITDPFANDVVMIRSAASLALHAACMLGSYEHVEQLLRLGANADGQISSSHKSCLKYFSGTCHMCNESNSTPLSIIAKCGSIDLAKLLLRYGADPNEGSASKLEGTALYNAVKFSTMEMVQVLLAAHTKFEVGQLLQLGEQAIQRQKDDILMALHHYSLGAFGTIPIAVLDTLLRRAAQQGCLQSVELLSNQISSSNPNPGICRSAFFVTALENAALHGHVHVMRYLVDLASNHNSETLGDSESLMLEAAIRSKNYRAVHYTLTSTASLIKENSSLNSLAGFDLAVELECMDIAQLLLQKRAFAFAEDDGGYKAILLKTAIWNNQLGTVASLLEEGVSPNEQPNSRRAHDRTGLLSQSPVYVAIKARNLEVLRLLLRYSVDLNINDGVCDTWHREDLSPMEFALAHNCVDAFLFFFEQTKHISVREEIVEAYWNESIRHRCSMSVSVMSRVLNSTMMVSGLVRIPVLAWSMYQDDDAFFEMLLHAGADIDMPLSSGGSPLQAALFTKKFSHAIRLITLGANLNGQPSRFRESGKEFNLTALQLASLRGHTECVSLMINGGADVNQPAGGVGGRTALQAACEKGFIQVAHKLIEAGASIDASPSDVGGNTAISLAVTRGRLDVLSLLLESCPDASITQRLLQEAEHIAESCHQTLMLDYLKEYRAYCG